MVILIILFLGVWISSVLWLVYELARAPMVEDDLDGRYLLSEHEWKKTEDDAA